MPEGRDSPVVRWLRDAARERLAYKGAALFFAIVLWLVVSAEEPSEQIVAVRVEISHDSARTMTSETPVVRALVVGRARELLKLYSDPLVIRRLVGPDAPDTVRLTLRPQDVHVPAGLDVVVRDLRPETVTATFVVRLTRRVPVRSRLQLMVDPSAPDAQPRLEPESVVVSGPRSAVERVASVPTVRTTIAVRDSTTAQVPLDLEELDRVRVRPTEVRLSFPLTRARATDSARRRPVRTDSSDGATRSW